MFKVIDKQIDKCNVISYGKNNLNIPVVILGDFNCNAQDVANRKSKTVKDYTTDGRTTIDLLFTNIQTDFRCGTLESYFSYHKPIWFALQQK